MAKPPIIEYTAYKIQPGVDLALSGEGTPNLVATYSDYGKDNITVKKADCTLSISYSDVQYTIDDRNVIVVTGKITGTILNRTSTGVATESVQEVTAWFNEAETFNQQIPTGATGSYDMNIPDTFRVTVYPDNGAQKHYPAAIHFKNSVVGKDPNKYPPDEFALGIIITNPNSLDYRPGQILNNGEWLSHDREGGMANIKAGNWREMRTQAGATNPPTIGRDGMWFNQKKIGKL